MHRRMIKDSGDFDPFELSYLYRRLRGRPSSVLAVPGLVMVAVLLALTLREGTFGRLADFQLVADLRRILGMPTPPSAPSFPLVRDVASWILLLTIAAGAILLHRQWKLMSECISQLTTNGALIMWKDQRELQQGKGMASRLLGLDPLLDRCTTENALPALVTQVMALVTRWRLVVSLCLGGLALALTASLLRGQSHGSFVTLAPRDLPPAQRQEWLDTAYQSWWASESHKAGYIIYGVFAFIAMYIILSYNAVGLVALYLFVALPFVARPSADWLNRDGRYGWTPLAMLYRSVLLAVALFGIGLTVTLAVLGLDNFPWIGLLVILYVIDAPLFAIAPRLTFRNAEAIAQRERIENIEKVIEERKLDLDRDFEALAPLVAEIEKCTQARIRPFRVRKASLSTFTAVILLPVMLAVAQILFPLRFGAI